jgi:hypothetical protein
MMIIIFAIDFSAMRNKSVNNLRISLFTSKMERSFEMRRNTDEDEIRMKKKKKYERNAD